MNLVKTRKVGNSVTVTLPKELGVDIGQEFIVSKGSSNAITLIPRLDNPFDGIADLSMGDDFEGVRLLDHEI